MDYAIALTISAVLGLTVFFLTRAITNWLSRPKSDAIQIKTEAGNEVTIPIGELSSEEVDQVIDAAFKGEEQINDRPKGLLQKFSREKDIARLLSILVFGIACIAASIL